MLRGLTGNNIHQQKKKYQECMIGNTTQSCFEILVNPNASSIPVASYGKYIYIYKLWKCEMGEKNNVYVKLCHHYNIKSADSSAQPLTAVGKFRKMLGKG